MNKDKIEDLKKKHPEGIHAGEISFSDAEDKLHKVEFVYRQPNTTDLESHIKASQKNPMVANLNLLQSLIIHPEPGPIIEAIRDFPMASAKFVDEAVTPFFGANVSFKGRKL